MISFGLSEEQSLVRDTAAEFAKSELRGRARECDESFECPQELLQRSWELGLVSAAIPEELGGGGMAPGHTTTVIALEELAYGCASLAAAALAPSLFVRPMLDFGTQEQQKEWLPRFAGDRFFPATLALQESQVTFDVTQLHTTAERQGDNYEISGEKRFVPLADRAGHILVIARQGEPGNLSNLSAFIVPRDAAGLSIGDARERSIGMQSLPWSRVVLNRVRVPTSARLGGDAGIDGRRLINSIRVGCAALSIGVARAVTEACIDYAKERVAFGQAIAQKQAIAFMLADMHTEVDCMRWMVWKAASQLEQGLDATKSAALAQDYVNRKALTIADNGIQIFGGHGFIRDFPLEMWFRNMRALTLIEGPVAA